MSLQPDRGRVPETRNTPKRSSRRLEDCITPSPEGFSCFPLRRSGGFPILDLDSDTTREKINSSVPPVWSKFPSLFFGVEYYSVVTKG